MVRTTCTYPLPYEAMESSAMEDVKPDLAAIQKLMPTFAGNCH